MIVEDTDEAAAARVDEIIAGADQGAISNILASADLDTNKGGTSDQLKAALDQSVEQGNMALYGYSGDLRITRYRRESHRRDCL